jgi:hypothetical protein
VGGWFFLDRLIYKFRGTQVGGFIRERIEGKEVQAALVEMIVSGQVKPAPDFHKTNLNSKAKSRKVAITYW